MKPSTAAVAKIAKRKPFIVSGNYSPWRIAEAVHGNGELLRDRRCTRLLAARRASASVDNTSFIDSGLPLSVSLTTYAIIWGIWSKRMLPARKAATAISSAALSAIGLAPPACAASYARRRQGNFSVSGGV